jgi:hypothetical protein
MEKDRIEIEIQKKKMIDEIKSIDKSKMFVPKQKDKISIFKKILMILGNGNRKKG